MTLFSTIFAFIIGVILSAILFDSDVKKLDIKNFFLSERFLGFLLQIAIAFLGFGVTLSVSNYNEVKNEKNMWCRCLNSRVNIRPID